VSFITTEEELGEQGSISAASAVSITGVWVLKLTQWHIHIASQKQSVSDKWFE